MHRSLPSISFFICALSGSTYGNTALDLLEKTTPEKAPYVAPSPARVAFEKEKEEQEEEKRTVEIKPRRWLDRVTSKIAVVKPKENPYFEEISFHGHAQWGATAGNLPNGENYTEARLRRLRLSAMMKVFYNTTIEVSSLHNGELGYEGIDRLTARTILKDYTAITVGKFRPPFTNHYSIDPTKRKTLDLPVGLNQLVPANSVGLYAEHQATQWDWGLGWFSRDADKNIPYLEGQGYVLGQAGYTFARLKDEPHLRWNLGYIYNFDESKSETIGNGNRMMITTGLQAEYERGEMIADFTLAHGRDNTIYDLAVTGSYDILKDKLELVGQYEYAASSEDAGLNVGFQISDPRADSLHPGLGQTASFADEMHRFYAGLNYHLLFEYAVLTAGLEYRILRTNQTDTFSDWIWHTGFKLLF